MKDTFELTADHVKLLRAANIDNQSGPYWGIIGLDSKRPFGSKHITDSMAKLLGHKPIETDDGEEIWPAGMTEAMRRIFDQLDTALQVVLRSGSFKPGHYEAEYCSGDWRRKEKVKEGA